jgi:hypothetical protein
VPYCNINRIADVSRLPQHGDQFRVMNLEHQPATVAPLNWGIAKVGIV